MKYLKLFGKWHRWKFHPMLLIIIPCVVIIAIVLSYRIACSVLLHWYQGVKVSQTLYLIPNVNFQYLEATVALDHKYLTDVNQMNIHMTVPETYKNINMHSIMVELMLVGDATFVSKRVTRIKYLPWFVCKVKEILFTLPMILGFDVFQQTVEIVFDISQPQLKQYKNVSVRISPGTLDWYDARILYQTDCNQIKTVVASFAVLIILVVIVNDMLYSWFNVRKNTFFTLNPVNNESKSRSIRSSDSAESYWSSN